MKRKQTWSRRKSWRVSGNSSLVIVSHFGKKMILTFLSPHFFEESLRYFSLLLKKMNQELHHLSLDYRLLCHLYLLKQQRHHHIKFLQTVDDHQCLSIRIAVSSEMIDLMKGMLSVMITVLMRLIMFFYHQYSFE
jgi:hypothetical protein